MLNTFITSLIAVVVTIGGWFGIQKVTNSPTLGAFDDPFISIQLADDPDNGECLTTNGTDNSWSTSCGTGGGGGGSGTWATTTSQVPGQNINYPLETDDIPCIGGTATSTCEYSFDPNVPRAYLIPNVGIGTTSPYAALSVVGEGVFRNLTATSTNATTTISNGIMVNGSRGVMLYNTFDPSLYIENRNNGQGIIIKSTGVSGVMDFRISRNGGGNDIFACNEFDGCYFDHDIHFVSDNVYHLGVPTARPNDINIGTGAATFGGTVVVPNLTSALLQTNGSGLFAEYAGTSCTNQFIRSLSALGIATCATVGSADVSLANLTATDATLTFSGTYNGSTARTIGLNLGNPNTWTALQQFNAHASSTQFSALDYVYVGRTATSTIQGTTAGTSTLQGFLNVSGTNSTSTFSGGLAATYLNLTGTAATSTFARGVDLAGGCFSINRVCIGGGSGSGTVTQINTTFPVLGGPITTSGTLTFGGLSTSTPAVIPNIPYFSGVNTFANAATGTLSCSGSVSCTSRFVIGGDTAISLTNPIVTGISLNGGSNFIDGSNSLGTAGYVLMTTGSTARWVATTTFSGGLVYSAGNVTADCVTITGSAGLCDGDDATGAGGGTFPFTPATNFNVTANGTTTPLWMKANPFGLMASTTIVTEGLLMPEFKISTSTSMTVSFASTTQMMWVGSSNITVSFSNVYAGGRLYLTVCNPDTGLIGSTTFSSVVWDGGVNPGSNTNNKQCDMFQFRGTIGTSTTNAIKVVGSLDATF